MNWPKLLKDLQSHGWSQTAIAERCKCAQSTINDLVSGRTSDPRHSIGQAIAALHGEVFHSDRVRGVLGRTTDADQSESTHLQSTEATHG